MPKNKELDDERFSQINWHPKFRRVPRQVRKVKIDKRFESMFKDPKFKLKHAVDKRGRPLGHTSTEDLRRYYDMPSESGSESEGEKEEEESENKKKRSSSTKKNEEHDDEVEEGSDQEESDQESSDEKEDADGKNSDDEIKLDLARGEGNISSSSEDSSSEWEFEEEDGAPLHDWDDVDTNKAPTIENSTSRLAICNMDWEKITARDILVLLNSFKPSSGIVRSVKIYPSDFGLQRLFEEQQHGPIELREFKAESGEENDDDDDDENDVKSFLDKGQDERQQKILLEKLRQYEFNRLKYYYAVAECDSVATAEHIYSNCDGMEYEASGTRLDLRFIPDGMEFDDRQPKDEASSFGDLATYRPTLFVNKSLQQSRPTLTWEEERDPKRVELARKAFENPEEWDRLELNGVLASPSSSEASDDEETAEFQGGVGDGSSDGEEKAGQEGSEKTRKENGYKSLLLESLKKSAEDVRPRKGDGSENDDVEMEIKWDANVEEKLEKAEKSKDQGDKKKSQWEKYLERRKEKRRQRKEEIRQKRLAVKRHRQGHDSDDDEFPPDFEDNPRTVKKSKKRGRSGPMQVEEDDSAEKKKQEAELDLLLADSDEEAKHRHFNLKKLLKADKKGLKSKAATSGDKGEKDEEDFTMNLEDPRFKAIFNSHLYNVDPSDPAFKKTPGMQRLVEEKIKTKNTKAPNRSVAKPEPVKDGAKTVAVGAEKTNEKPTNPDLSLLAKKVKAKTDMFRKEKERRSLKKVRS